MLFDILEITSLTNFKPIDSPMDSNQKLVRNQGELFLEPKRYRRFVGKLIYITITRPDLSYPVGIVSQFMWNPQIDHWNVMIRILIYVKGNPRN